MWLHCLPVVVGTNRLTVAREQSFLITAVLARIPQVIIYRVVHYLQNLSARG